MLAVLNDEGRGPFAPAAYSKDVTMQDFQEYTGSVAGVPADDGRGKAAYIPQQTAQAPCSPIRDSYARTFGERALIDHIVQTLEAAGFRAPRSLVTNYYVSLKANPFVVLAGAEGYGKADFVAIFAEALLGRDSRQYALIPAGAAWSRGTGEDGYYRGVVARFASMRFLDLLQDAAGPAGAGKAYLICFNGLHPVEFEYYFTSLIQVDDRGRTRLALPGVAHDDRPIVPPNVSITATVHTAEYVGAISPALLRSAALIDLATPLRTGPVRRTASPPPPVGYQRLWLRAATRDVAVARERLAGILGPARLMRLGCSPHLRGALWDGGIALSSRDLAGITLYVAASFDEQGRGLFDEDDPLRNAQIAYDAQVMQRVMWRASGAGPFAFAS
jgi:hypothetical protein